METSSGAINTLSNQNLFVNTLLTRTNSGGTTNITDYFRAALNVPFSLAGATFRINHATDDGAVFYFNGTEVARFNMPTGAVDYLTEALVASTEGLVRTISGLTGLNTGDNSIAVSVHQNDLGSSDVLFGMEVLAIYGVIPPQLTVIRNIDGSLRINSSGSGSLYSAADLSGPWSLVGSTFPVNVTPSEPQRFFQVRP